MTPSILFHGGQTEIKSVDWSRFQRDSPFGPGLYMSAARDTAAMYAKRNGVIHAVHMDVVALRDSVFDLDIDYAGQPSILLRKVCAVAWSFGLAEAVSPVSLSKKGAWTSRDVYEQIEAGVKEKYFRGDAHHVVNQTFAMHGILMLQGHIHPMMDSGLMDRGVQYVALSDKAIKRIRISHTSRQVADLVPG